MVKRRILNERWIRLYEEYEPLPDGAERVGLIRSVDDWTVYRELYVMDEIILAPEPEQPTEGA